ncbi:tigger transposable element-derived protein 1-like [Macrobrachium nipponense]|uniref:tigger transposable element-derived protein 1-like n=1 Tax=Macrobrachium nipponense TaxID=159736 RepID=UPI0030C81D6F
MEVKFDVDKHSEKGETNTEIGRALGLRGTTVVTIVKDKERILKHIKDAAPMKATVINVKQRSQSIVEMEKLLMIWLEDQNQRRVPVSLSVIQEKARELHEAVAKKHGEGSVSGEFSVSRGWFNRFKARAIFHNVKLQGEAASADSKAADSFPSGLAEIIKDDGYTADQVFNVDETGLFWKRMPNRTYLSKEEKSAPGHKAGNERLTLLFGANASGDLKLKPLLLYLAENPRAFKGIFKSQLPVIWKSNKKVWVTLMVFEDWFNDHSVPAVEWYLSSKGLPFKVLLVLDKSPGAPSNLSNMHPNVKVVYLPLNTTLLIQPMDQGVIANFKAYYLRRTIRSALRAIEGNKELTLKQFWKGYNITDAVRNIASAWDEVKTTTLNGAWKKLCPQFVHSFEGFDRAEDVETVTREIIGLSKRLKLDLEAEDVLELLASHGEELSSEDLIELEQEMIEEELEVPDPKPRSLTVKGLSEGFTHLERALVSFEGEDPNVARFDRIRRGIMDLVTFYKETLKEKQMKKSVQSRLDTFFHKSPIPLPAPSPEVMANPDPPVLPGPSVAARPPLVEPFDSDDDPDDPEPFHGFDVSPYSSDSQAPANSTP